MNNNSYDADFQYGISRSFKDANIFITGATGFLGKVLVEKLLRSCGELDSLYILIRPKRGLDVQQRLGNLLENPIFNRIREDNPKVLLKIKIIYGDMSLPNLGISSTDLSVLKDINFVIHSAATVKFNESLRSALTLNTIGTKNLLNICKEMIKLKAFVYVSTAYSNPFRKTVQEEVYSPKYHYESIINFIQNFPDEDVNLLCKRIMANHPNTYTFTKALAEQIVLEYSKDIPSCIVRPSIITSAWKEPYEGWVDSFSGITGIFAECGRGTITSVVCDRECLMDLIPVDIVANTIIAAAWQTGLCRTNSLKVYNCTSGNIHPIRCKEFELITNKHFPSYPTKYITLWPHYRFRKNEYVHSIYAVIFHKLPAIILDMFMYLTTRKTMMLRLGKRCWEGMDRIKYFTTKEWDFHTSNMENLTKAVKKSLDGEKFTIDIKASNGFDWDSYLKSYIIGIRLYLLKDDMKTLPKAKAKLARIYWIKKVWQLFVVFYMIRFVFKFLK